MAAQAKIAKPKKIFEPPAETMAKLRNMWYVTAKMDITKNEAAAKVSK
ncbi:hypothetical protein MO973_19705 [Paenibacillus sp. TRM 82003]|nr:hypothetical protein [Paenibacillus sp. TRM 82003]